VKVTKEMLKEHVSGLVDEVLGDKFSEWQEHTKEQARKYEDKMAEMLRDQPQSKPNQAKGERAGRFIRCLAAGGGRIDRAVDFANRIGDKDVAKALGESTLAGGGALVPPEMASEVIELLYDQSTVRALGARTMPMNNGSLTLPYIATGASAAYVGENTNITKSEQTTGQLNLTARKLAVLTPISNDLLRDTAGAADGIVRDDLVQAASVKEDATFIRSAGASAEPKGMRYWAASGNVFATAGTSVANVTTDLTKAIRFLKEGKIPMLKPGWIMAPRSEMHLMGQRDGNNNLVWADEMRQGKLFGIPYKATNQIPITLSSDKSELYLADFSQLVIGETTDMLVEVFDSAAYHDGSAVVSAVSQDQSVVRLIMRHDFGDRQRGASIAVVTTVAYGA
jgi:HK97 family phage major capsid protein